MEMTVRNSGEITIVHIEGMLDGASSPAAQTVLENLIAEGATKILFNFELLSFISSAGLRTLLIAAKELQRRAGELRVCNPNESVLEVFEISGFNSIIAVSMTEPEALESF